MPDERAASPQSPRTSGFKDLATLTCLVVAGLAYFSQYYRHGFNVADEGSVVLIAARLLAGERPFLDIELGYGLLWFYPIVALFEMTGVSFIAVRVFFSSLAITTGLLAFLTVRKQTSRRGLAAVIALAVLAVPGTLHKTYIPLIVVANMLCLPEIGREKRVLGGAEVFRAALVVAFSYHIRPDLGLCAALVLAVTLTVWAMSGPPSWPRRALQLGRQSLLVVAAALVPTVPLLAIARAGGFLPAYLSLLHQPVKYLRGTSADFLAELKSSFLAMVWIPRAWAAPAPMPDLAEAGQTLARTPLAAAWGEGPGRDLAVLTYLPLLTLAMIAGLAGLLAVRGIRRSRSAVAGEAIGALALLGLAYSAFPQFYLFRPDIAHISQFMPGYVVLVGIFLGRWLWPVEGTVWARSGAPAGPVAWRVPAALIRAIPAGFLVLHVAFYVMVGLRYPGSGSIALARGRTESFQGANGVDVVVKPQEKKLFAAVTRIVEEHAGENDFVLCFPYCPGFNVMTERPTFARRLYVDDGTLILDPDWQRRMIDRIDRDQVPLIIIEDWAINGTEISRFENWAVDVMAYIAVSYEPVERSGRYRFYARQDRRIAHEALPESGG